MTGLELCGLLLCVRASVHCMTASAHKMPKTVLRSLALVVSQPSLLTLNSLWYVEFFVCLGFHEAVGPDNLGPRREAEQLGRRPLGTSVHKLSREGPSAMS